MSPARHILRAYRAALWMALWVMTSSCSRTETARQHFPPAPGKEACTVMTFNLHRFGFADRDGNGQADNFKPAEELDAVIETIAAARPDVLTVQEIGDADALEMLQRRLVDAGLDYPYRDLVTGATRDRRLGMLSKYPLIHCVALTNYAYRIQETSLPVQRGFQQVDVDTGSYTMRIIHVHLKSKDFHAAGQTEMRRNEARLLATHVRRMLRDEPGRPVLICGDFSDRENSAALRELTGDAGAAWHVLPVTDEHGDFWTHHDGTDQIYARHDFFVVNEALRARWIPEHSGVIRHRAAARASDHRPLVAAFNLNGPSPARSANGSSD